MWQCDINVNLFHRVRAEEPQETADDGAGDAVWTNCHRHDYCADGLPAPEHVRGQSGAAVQVGAVAGVAQRIEAGREPARNII